MIAEAAYGRLGVPWPRRPAALCDAIRSIVMSVWRVLPDILAELCPQRKSVSYNFLIRKALRILARDPIHDDDTPLAWLDDWRLPKSPRPLLEAIWREACERVPLPYYPEQ